MLASPSRPSSTRSNFTSHAIYDDPAGRRKSRDTPPDTAGGRRCYTHADTIPKRRGPRDEILIEREFLSSKTDFLLGQANPESTSPAIKPALIAARVLAQSHEANRAQSNHDLGSATVTFPRQAFLGFLSCRRPAGAEDLARDACANRGTSWFARHLTAPQSLASVYRVGTLPAAKLPRYRRQRLPEPTRRQHAIWRAESAGSSEPFPRPLATAPSPRRRARHS